MQGRVGRYRADPQSSRREGRRAKLQSQDCRCRQQKNDWRPTQVSPALERQTGKDGKSHTGRRAGPRHGQEGVLELALTLWPQGPEQDPGMWSRGQHSKSFQTFLRTQAKSLEDRAVLRAERCDGDTPLETLRKTDRAAQHQLGTRLWNLQMSRFVAGHWATGHRSPPE